MRQQYSYQKRNSKKGKIYYVQRWNADLGRYDTARSTGQTSKASAIKWVSQEEQVNPLIRNRSKTPTTEEFADNFFSPFSDYIIHRKTEQKSIGLGHMKNQQAKVRNYIVPFFKSTPLDKITSKMTLDFKTNLIQKGLSNQSIDQTLYALKALLEWAHEKNYIHVLPSIRFCKGNENSTPSILSTEEVRKLIHVLDFTKPQDLITLIAYTTGMRQGEILGLTWDRFDFEKMIVNVEQSWDRTSKGLKKTKTGKDRVAPLCSKVVEILLHYQKSNFTGMGTAFVFPGRGSDHPLDRKYVERTHNEQLEKIGIDAHDKVNRKIVFHSSRHFVNSFLINNGVGEVVVASMLGHANTSMTMNYYHTDGFSLVREKLESLMD